MLISIPGKWFPRNNDPERYDLYCTSMLALLRPWRVVVDLQASFISLRDAFDAFVRDAPKRTKDIMSNIQYYHESADTANRKLSGTGTGVSIEGELDTPEDEQTPTSALDNVNDLISSNIEMTEEMLAVLERGQISQRARMHGEDAVRIARNRGIFRGTNTHSPQPVRPESSLVVGSRVERERLAVWRRTMSTQTNALAENATHDHVAVSDEGGAIKEFNADECT